MQPLISKQPIWSNNSNTWAVTKTSVDLKGAKENHSRCWCFLGNWNNIFYAISSILRVAVFVNKLVFLNKLSFSRHILMLQSYNSLIHFSLVNGFPSFAIEGFLFSINFKIDCWDSIPRFNHTDFSDHKLLWNFESF